MPLDSIVTRRKLEDVLGREHQTLAYQTKDPWTFVASTEAVDRYGDIIVADGWDLRNFKKNPIALWQHNSSQPIGNWADVRVEEDQLVARLEMVKPGISSIADMLRGMLETRVLRAVSVGFIPLKAEEILDSKGNWTGYRFTKSELLEISVVSVPANPEALALARSLGASPETMELLRSKTGVFQVRSIAGTPPGPSAHPPANTTNPKGKTTMPTIAERIASREAAMAVMRDQIAELGTIEDPNESQDLQLQELTANLTASTAALATLKNAQAALLASAAPAGADTKPPAAGGGETPPTTPPSNGAAPRLTAPPGIRSRGQKDPAALLFRTAFVVARSHIEKRPMDDIIRNTYGGSKDLEALVRAVTDPAMTTVTGWAAELVGETIGAFIDVLRPNSVFFNVPMSTFTFGRSKLRLPTRNSGKLNGDFVAEGAPIPVKSVVLGSVLLEPHKLGVITTMTRELQMLSDPAAEPLFREMMIGDTRETIDSLFMDNVAAVPTLRPAGLQQLAGANTAASSGTTLANIITDLKAAIQAMANKNMGRQLCWIMNTQRALSLGLVTNAAGNFMFRDELVTGTLLGIPVVASTTVPPAIVFLVDGAELAAAYDETPQMDISDQATLHMESTPATVPPTADTVAPIAYPEGGAPGGTPGTAALGDFAQPVRSLWQTATLGLRLLWDITWNQRRAGAVYTITGVAW